MVGYMDYQKNGNEYFVPGSGVNTIGATDTRYRVQHRFMLDENDIDDKELSQWFKGLRKDRQFTPTIRNAMSLVHDLQRGSTDQLDSQFPYLYDRLVEQVKGELEKSYKKEINDRDKRITELETENRIKDEHIERLERLLASRPVQAPSEAPALRTVSAPKADYAEPELEIKMAKGDGKKATENFIQSLVNIQTSYKKHAPLTVKISDSAPEPEGNPKAIAGSGATFAAPDLDDLVLE